MKKSEVSNNLGEGASIDELRRQLAAAIEEVISDTDIPSAIKDILKNGIKGPQKPVSKEEGKV